MCSHLCTIQNYWRNQHIIFIEVLVRNSHKYTKMGGLASSVPPFKRRLIEATSDPHTWPQQQVKVKTILKEKWQTQYVTASERWITLNKSLMQLLMVKRKTQDTLPMQMHRELLVQIGISTGTVGTLKNLKWRQIRLSLKGKPLGWK